MFDYGSIGRDAAQASQGGLTEGSPYLAMEFASGGTLRDARPSNWSELRELLMQLLDALAFAHARDIIHRDIKPDNILCFPESSPGSRRKLSDFGIASALGVNSVTKSGRFEGASAGTPHYMSPEQLMAHWRDFGPWTDLYSLGCMAWELVAQRRPFRKKNPIALGHQHLREPLPPLEPTYPVPDEFDAYLRRMAAKEPTDRFRCAADAIDALERISGGEGRPGAPDSCDDPTASPAPSPPSATGSHADSGPDNSEQTLEHARTTPSNNAPSNNTPSNNRGHTDTPNDDESTELADTVVSDARGWPHARRPTESAPSSSSEQALLTYEPPPPMPDTWATERGRSRASLLGAGLGLFGLRAIPFVGRDRERDVIWRALSDVVDQQQPRCVMIRGASGTGKTRLAEWMAYRANEVGAATHLKIAHSRQGGASEGIPGLLDYCFATWNLNRHRAQERIRECLVGDPLVTEAPPLVEDDVRALTELVRPTSGDNDDDSHHFASAAERYTLVERQLARRAGDRPLVLWIDDVQWGSDVLGLVEHLLDRPDPLPMLVLFTVRTDALPDRPSIRERLEQFVSERSVSVLDIDPLDETQHARLIDELLKLEDDLAEQVLERTQGRPLFAVQLIGDWVASNQLEVGRDGFRLVADGSKHLPENIHQLWHRRIERVLEAFEPARRRALRRSLELAAAFGQHVDRDELEHACRDADLPIAPELAEQLVERGLVQRDRTGFSFTHAMLSESLQQQARDEGRLETHHLRCARTLERMYRDGTVDAASRRAGHLESAGHLEDALTPLRTAAVRARKLGDFMRAEQLLQRRASVIDALSLADDDGRRVENWWLSGKLYVSIGHREAAAELANRTLEALDRSPTEERSRSRWHSDNAHAHAINSMLLRESGDLDASHRALDQARENFQIAGEGLELAECVFDRAELAAIAGEYGVARSYYREANDRFEALGDPIRQAAAMSHIGYCWSAEGEYEQAREETERALALADDAGARHAKATCLTHLGEIARFQDDWEGARRHYKRAVEINRACGSRNLYVCKFNLASVQIATGDFEDARDGFRDLSLNAERYGLASVDALIDLGLACCAAGLDDWWEWDTLMPRVQSQLAEQDIQEPDLPWLAGRAASLALEASEVERARAAGQIAIEHWRATGDDERAKELQERLR